MSTSLIDATTSSISPSTSIISDNLSTVTPNTPIASTSNLSPTVLIDKSTQTIVVGYPKPEGYPKLVGYPKSGGVVGYPKPGFYIKKKAEGR